MTDPARPGVLVLRRPYDLGGVVRRVKVTVDDHVVAAVKAGETVEVPLAPGAHVLVASMDWARSPEPSFEVVPEGSIAVQVSMPFTSVFTSFYAPGRALTARLTT